jgi:hypothetical protein
MDLEIGNVIYRIVDTVYHPMGYIGVVTRNTHPGLLQVKRLNDGKLKYPHSDNIVKIADSLDKLPLLYRLIL